MAAAGARALAWSPPPLWQTFPPLFTLQPNDATRARQLDTWAALLVSWAAAHAHAVIAPLADWPLWENRALARRLPPEGVRAVADLLVARGRAEWADGDARAALRVVWHTPAEWAALVFAHVDAHGFINGDVTTVGDLLATALGADFAGLDAPTLARALDELARREPPAALLYPAPSGNSEDIGVRFVK